MSSGKQSQGGALAVSLVIPNRNNARYLKQCLESALSQTLSFGEIVVVDDASEDDSRPIVRAIAREVPSLHLIEIDRRIGVSLARDLGIRSTNGRFITTLDSDDFFWGREKNEREYKLLERESGAARPVIAFSDFRLVSEGGIDLGSWAERRPVREGDVFRWILELRGFEPRDFTMRRADYFRAGGYNPDLDLYEDWDLKLRLSRFCDFRYTGVDGVAYRQNPHGLSRAAFTKHTAAMRRIILVSTHCLPEPTRSIRRIIALTRAGWFLRGAIKRAAIEFVGGGRP